MTVPLDEKTLTCKTKGDDYDKPQNPIANFKEVLFDYLDGTAGYLMKKTWLAAIKAGYFSTWPGLTFDLVTTFLPQDTEETAAGHLQCQRQGIQSTKDTPERMEPELEGKGRYNRNKRNTSESTLYPMKT